MDENRVPDRTGLVRRLALGFGMQGVSMAALTLLQLLTVPLCLSAWGAAVYADWLVLSATAGLLGLIDCGLSGCLGNGLRSAWARGDHEGFHRILHTGLFVYAGLVGGAVVVLAGAAATTDLPALLGVARLEQGGTVLVLLALAVILLLPRGAVAAIYSARGEFNREVGSILAMSAGQLTVQAAVVLAGGTPLHVAVAMPVAALFFGWGVLLPALARHHPDVSLSPAWPDRPALRRLAVRLPLYAVPPASAILLLHIPVLALGRLSAPAELVAFTTMRTFSGLIRQISAQFATITGIEMAAQHARNDLAGAAALLSAAGPLTGGMVGLLTGLAMAIGPGFFNMWTRGAVGFDPMLAALFLGAVLAMAPANGAVGLLRFMDQPGPMARCLLAQAVCSLLLCLLLIPTAGAAGAAGAISSAEVLTVGLYGGLMAGRLVGAPMTPMVLHTCKVALLSLGLSLGVAWVVGQGVAAVGAGLIPFVVLWGLLTAGPALWLIPDRHQRAWLAGRARRIFRTPA
jgi:hypothetical protein